RPPGHALRRPGIDPGRNPLPAPAPGSPRRRGRRMMARGGTPFELFIGLRYMRSKGRRGFLSLLTLIAMAGMALGVMALILVLGVMTGAEEEFMGKILGTTAHVMVLDTGSRGIEDVERVLNVVRAHREVRVAAPFVLQQAMLSTDQGATGVV